MTVAPLVPHRDYSEAHHLYYWISLEPVYAHHWRTTVCLAILISKKPTYSMIYFSSCFNTAYDPIPATSTRKNPECLPDILCTED